MNDFTKDELENIAQQDNLLQSVFDKVESMIDNYDKDCKHNLIMTDTFEKCADCNKILGF